MLKIAILASLGGLIAALDLSSQDFRISINGKTGAIYKITDPLFNDVVNWVVSGSNAPWLPTGSRWCLGYADLGQDYLHRNFWNFPQITKRDNTVEAVHIAGTLELLVSRSITDENRSFTESYTFTNKGASTLNLNSRGTTSLAIYGLFNDHYTNTSDCVKLSQMGGNYRNLGFVLAKGALVGYSIESRDPVTLSNTRGVFLLHPSIPILEPGASSTIAWTWFWHSDWDDFFKQSAARSKQFVRVETDYFTSITRDSLYLSHRGQVLQCDETGRPGRTNLVVTTDNGYNSTLSLNTVPKYDDLISSRTKFMIENQQDTTPDTPAEGAYRVFDNQANNVQVRQSLEKYSAYVSTKLPIGMDGSKKRLYNWHWVLQFRITVAALDLNLRGIAAEKTPLERFMLTLENFYPEGGGELHAIGLPILEKSSRAVSRPWTNIAARGQAYPSFEVNLEQSIIAPAAVTLLELWRYTGNEDWLDAGKLHLNILLHSAGKQLDYRLHDLAIRHWDGYWFDTFPHFWSTLNGITLHHYAKGLKNDTQRQGAATLKTANGITRNNLALFEANGRASCAYIYPTSVNGRAENYKDPYANDQDWALTHLLRIEDDAFVEE
ncbi:hypothetical protein BDP55DRAFT_705600 [Colletotrichum godetiae]|uniref:Six-hairpin glycosidase n=1 Tax=Colletotrichum godetiae TaxID=1209918 RepID=A0AAJ0EVE5_9PEZI|nr:uncharacterized protein BDP55DRAFT_705600 [Colletotrichum godetiae]KAK1673180.1 hypothetical protein BDP55DRAFT_705600 [Colletotrichum godetiae]